DPVAVSTRPSHGGTVTFAGPTSTVGGWPLRRMGSAVDRPSTLVAYSRIVCKLKLWKWGSAWGATFSSGWLQRPAEDMRVEPLPGSTALSSSKALQGKNSHAVSASKLVSP